MVSYFKVKLRVAADGGLFNDDSEVILTREELESKRECYVNAFDDYNEMVIQFGYVTLFAPAFPLASLLALLNNIVEIRTDAQKLCTSFQRPIARRENDIGSYLTILEIMSIAAVCTNSGIIAFTSDVLVDNGLVDEDNTAGRVWFAVVLEHLLLITKIAMKFLISDVPDDVRDEMVASEYFSKRDMKTESTLIREHDVLEIRQEILRAEFDYERMTNIDDWHPK
eukprot:TRINITY_DN9264_c0_g1_i2.p1 TRINITY_DN9264_c0_g1~~TRINITY_DN9264_c0_g1_i2.p1  ORF type:complete len:225 (+),score=38.66 TRINITY_DN9264_c0_g1_i2:55-729(+)